MSNIGSTALQTAKRQTQQSPHVPPQTAGQSAFNRGTMGMLDDARGVIENAVGQGMELNPQIYQMLGLDPQYEDHSGDLQGAQSEMDAAQKQFDQAQQQLNQLKGIPKGQRTPQQRQQFRQLNKGMAQMQKSLGDAKNHFQQLQTMPKTITGFNRLDPSKIPANSPFSSLNPLNQAQATESQRLNQYLQGGEVDPTLKHQYDAAEQSLRAQLSQRYGPDYANSSVGQMALQNFSRQKNEAFATWNQQQVDKYNQLAFGGASNLQSLLAGQIGLMQEPSQFQMNMGTQLSNDASQRLQQQQINDQMRLGRAGLGINTSQSSPVALAGGALGGIGQLLKTPYNSQGDTLGGALTGGNAAQPSTVNVPADSALSGWASGGGGAAATDAAVGGASLEGGGVASMLA